ncbi:MAG: hypothetical protein EP329_28205 [Deltaproteobacteria bacterium]|nr:MAG: hypothetical protein EP329_28205 [Deltaproteobacteria bacterium]
MNASLLPRTLGPAVLLPTLLLTLATTGASAAAPTVQSAVEPPEWALGASVGLGLVGLGGLGGIGAGLASDTLVPGVVLERRLAARWWLLTGLEASYADLGESDSRALHARIGVRYVLDPGAPVTVAPTFALVGGTAYAGQDGFTSDGTSVRTESHASSVGAEIGLDVSLAVTTGFALRLHTTLLTARWTSLGTTSGDDETRLEGVTAALALRPTLAAVLAF